MDGKVEVLSVAMDAQGPDRVRPYVEAAGVTFTTLIDSDNILGQIYGFKAIPNGFLIDERGVVRYKKLGGFDIRRVETKAVLDRWVSGEDPAPGRDWPVAGPEFSESNELFRQGMVPFRQGRVEEAVELWHAGLEHDPDNYIIRKQIWAIEHPGRFYEGDVDYTWQRAQIADGP